MQRYSVNHKMLYKYKEVLLWGCSSCDGYSGSRPKAERLFIDSENLVSWGRGAFTNMAQGERTLCFRPLVGWSSLWPSILLFSSFFLFETLNHHTPSVVSNAHSRLLRTFKFSNGDRVIFLKPGSILYFRARLWNPESRFYHPSSDGPGRYERPIFEWGETSAHF